MNLINLLVRIVWIGLGLAAAALLAVFVIGIGALIFLFSVLTGRRPKFQVYNARTEGFQPQVIRDVTPLKNSELG
jgi:hypothetical protein